MLKKWVKKGYEEVIEKKVFHSFDEFSTYLSTVYV